MQNLLDLDREGLAAFCESLGEKRFRATQLFRWIHQKGAADFGAMTDLARSDICSKSEAPFWWIQRYSWTARKRFSPSDSQ